MMTGKLQLRRTAVNVEEIARAVLEIVQPAAERKQIEIAFHSETPLPALQADGIRIHQVFWNLLSNAIKFTPEHGVIHLHVRQAGEAIEIVVSDTGQGIPAELLRAISDPFRQADSSTTRVHGGLGLGLSIVKYITDAHAGSAEAESPGTGRGSTFTVRLPLSSTPAVGPESAAPALPIPSRARLPGATVLVVDDDADTREMVAAYLAQHGMSVQTASSAEEAIEIVQREPVAVLLVDLAMPDEAGYTLMRRIRSSPSPAIAALPAAALSALARVDDRAQAIKAGFQLYVSTPVNSTMLVNAVATLLQEVSIPN
jgi:CheY-like chemotaxis protein/anti-sigma regulatory factor (Ser/Thr protein kinase)